MSDTAQKTANGLSPGAFSPPQLPGNDPLNPPLRPVGVKGPGHCRQSIQFHLPGGLQAVVGPDIGGFVCMGVGFYLLHGSLGGGQVIEPSQVHIPIHRRRILRLQNVGAGPVRNGAAQLRQHHTVQGIRVS